MKLTVSCHCKFSVTIFFVRFVHAFVFTITARFACNAVPSSTFPFPPLATWSEIYSFEYSNDSGTFYMQFMFCINNLLKYFEIKSWIGFSCTWIKCTMWNSLHVCSHTPITFGRVPIFARWSTVYCFIHAKW